MCSQQSATYVFQPRQGNPWIARRWNNNACESTNHLLKLSIDWRPRRLPEVTDRAPVQSGSVSNWRLTSRALQPRKLRSGREVRALPTAAHCLAGKVTGREGCALQRVPCCQAAQSATENYIIKGRRPDHACGYSCCVCCKASLVRFISLFAIDF